MGWRWPPLSMYCLLGMNVFSNNKTQTLYDWCQPVEWINISLDETVLKVSRTLYDSVDLIKFDYIFFWDITMSIIQNYVKLKYIQFICGVIIITSSHTSCISSLPSAFMIALYIHTHIQTPAHARIVMIHPSWQNINWNWISLHLITLPWKLLDNGTPLQKPLSQFWSLFHIL